MALAELPGPYDVRQYAVRARAVTTNTCMMAPYRGVSRPVITLAMERLMDCAADQLGIDPVELRSRNLIRSFPYRSVTGLLFDEGSYLASLERAAAEVDLPAFRARQQAARAQGAPSRHRLLPVQRAHRLRHARLCRARHGDHPGLRAGRDHAWTRPATSRRGSAPRRTARAWRRRSAQLIADELGVEPCADPHHPWRHRPDAVWLGHLRQPLDGDFRRRLQARGRGAARQAREARRPCAGGRPRRHRDPGGQCARARHRHDDRSRDARAPGPSPEPSLRRRARPEPVAQATYDPAGTFSNACHVAVVEVDPETGRGRHRALPRGRGRRRADQSHDRRGPGAWRRRPGHRQCAVRGDRLRRRRQHPDRLARRLSAADLRRDPADRDPPHRDPERCDPDPRQGPGRGRRDRRTGCGAQRHLRCAEAVRGRRVRDAGDAAAHPRADPRRRGPGEQRHDHLQGHARRQRRALRGRGRAAPHARRCDPRRLRPDRHPPRLRARRLRRLHGAPRRPARALLPDVRGPGGGRERSAPSRGLPTATRCIRCRRRSGSTTGCNAASARRAS